jgi:hypothetical protein
LSCRLRHFSIVTLCLDGSTGDGADRRGHQAENQQPPTQMNTEPTTEPKKAPRVVATISRPIALAVSRPTVPTSMAGTTP